jgi:hypothetical protein
LIDGPDFQVENAGVSLHDLICVFYSKITPVALHNLCTLGEFSRWGGFRRVCCPFPGSSPPNAVIASASEAIHISA